ncbi:hypothetical protein LOTGIDRAFT_239204 [Lottia gigantea]|uniref:C-type lectin domain-containing protein n=1 Tax=Lottia gigantea TaxID=225164 RepID=V4ATM4_LOTGI|nr:hypothetical protein LOTGIDRAFT_239204 [Lottia gigantea]ESO97101.1 hypothetical protein LOTGIDRAFT_239204 [Lottia gigantea]
MSLLTTCGGCISLLRSLVLFQMILWIDSKPIDGDPVCLPSTFRRIEIYTKLLSGFANITTETSLTGCSEQCAGFSGCQSFGFNTINKTCYLYMDRVKISSSSTTEEGMVYYWLLRDTCPASYYKNPELSLCFLPFLSDKKPVLEAEKRCEQDGGHLIIIDSVEKEKFLAEFLTVDQKQVKSLVGGVELVASTEDWKWFNGANVTNWNVDQPDNYKGIEDCLQAVFKPKTKTTVFNDTPCEASKKHRFICEIPIV